VDISPLLFVAFEFWDYIPLTLVIVTVTSKSHGFGNTGKQLLAYFARGASGYR